MSIDSAKTLAARHGGQIEREILWLVSEVERLQPRQGPPTPQPAPSEQTATHDAPATAEARSEAIRAGAARGDLVTPEQVLALCDEAERYQQRASLWGDNIEALTRERDVLRAAIIRALDACPFCRQGECRAEAHRWLRDALSSDVGAPLLSLLHSARAWAGALKSGDEGEIERRANELILAIARCGG